MLVSIIVITYNSEKFITETLESIRLQTYQELELIISDDCSSDKTVEICRSWLNNHRDRFVRTELLTVPHNKGIAANCNHGTKYAKGEWIKYCAGDDCLLPNCIEANISWIRSLPEIRVLFSRVEIYRDTFEPQNLLKTTPDNPFNPEGIMAQNRSAESQYKMLLISDRIHFTTSVFLHRETLLSVGGLDERFKILEDYPLWLNFTKNGHKLYFMDKVTMNYRSHSKAINNTDINYLINPNYFKLEYFRKVCTYPYLPADVRLNQRYNWYASQIFRWDWLNRNNKTTRLLLSLLTIYLNPFKYYLYLKKRLNRNLKDNEFYT